MTKISRIPSLLASATAKGPCKHNRLYLCVGGRICVLVTGMLFRYTQGSGRTLGYCWYRRVERTVKCGGNTNNNSNNNTIHTRGKANRLAYLTDVSSSMENNPRKSPNFCLDVTCVSLLRCVYVFVSRGAVDVRLPVFRRWGPSEWWCRGGRCFLLLLWKYLGVRAQRTTSAPIYVWIHQSRNVWNHIPSYWWWWICLQNFVNVITRTRNPEDTYTYLYSYLGFGIKVCWAGQEVIILQISLCPTQFW